MRLEERKDQWQKYVSKQFRTHYDIAQMYKYKFGITSDALTDASAVVNN